MDIRRADLRLLVALEVLLAERSVTRAAERLSISQPAMSAQLARLRDLFDDPLLVASGRQMVPTTKALEIEQPLRRVLEDLTRIVRERQDFDPPTATNTFRIVATDYMHTTVTLPLMQAVAGLSPHVRIASLLLVEKLAWTMIENGEADLLIVSRGRTPPAAKARRLYEEGFTFVQRKGHPRGTRRLTLAQFCKLKHVLISPGGGSFKGPIDQTLQTMGKTRDVVASLPSFLLAPTLVEQTDLVAALPTRLANLLQDRLDCFQLPFETACFDVMLAWHPRHQNDPAHVWLRELAFETAKAGRDH